MKKSIKDRLIKPADLSNIMMVNGKEQTIKAVIDFEPVVKRWVGIGWVSEGEPTQRQMDTLPIIDRGMKLK